MSVYQFLSLEIHLKTVEECLLDNLCAQRYKKNRNAFISIKINAFRRDLRPHISCHSQLCGSRCQKVATSFEPNSPSSGHSRHVKRASPGGSVRQADVVHPQRVAHRAHVCAAVARVELQHDVGGRFVGGGPSHLLHRHHVALRVAGILGFVARGQCPGRAVELLAPYVAVVDGKARVVLPVRAFAPSVNHGPYALRVDVSLLVLPPKVVAFLCVTLGLWQRRFCGLR